MKVDWDDILGLGLCGKDMTTGNQWYLTIYLDSGTQGLEELNIIIDDNLSPTRFLVK